VIDVNKIVPEGPNAYRGTPVGDNTTGRVGGSLIEGQSAPATKNDAGKTLLGS
jgi:hypothetical protein